MSLTVKDLTKRYGDRTVVDRLSFGMPGPGCMPCWAPTAREKPPASA